MSEPKQCQCCNNEPAHNGNECRMCHAALTAMCVIRDNWTVDEYRDLGVMLRQDSLPGLVATWKGQQAFKAVRLGQMLIRLGWLSGKSEDEFKRKLFDRMTRDHGELESIRKLPGGTDGWNKRVAAHIGTVMEAVRKTAGKSHV